MIGYPKDFPIMGSGGQTIPWAVLEPHAEQARINHDQSLAVLARRGGLEWCEALAILEERPWRKMHHKVARALVLQLVARIAGEPTASQGHK